MFLVLRATPRLLCTAAQQKSSGTGTEEDNGAHKPDLNATEKALTEEKAQLEEQLKDVTVLQFIKLHCIKVLKCPPPTYRDLPCTD